MHHMQITHSAAPTMRAIIATTLLMTAVAPSKEPHVASGSCAGLAALVVLFQFANLFFKSAQATIVDFDRLV